MTKNKFKIEINNLTEEILSFDLKKFINNAIKLIKINPIFLELSLINDDQIKEIHNKYMNLNTTTDVITFNLNTVTEPHGDIYICIDEAKRNAKALNHSLNFEIKTLIIHALLHLNGFTDTTKTEKEKMFTKQDQILQELLNYNELQL